MQTKPALVEARAFSRAGGVEDSLRILNSLDAIGTIYR